MEPVSPFNTRCWEQKTCLVAAYLLSLRASQETSGHAEYRIVMNINPRCGAVCQAIKIRSHLDFLWLMCSQFLSRISNALGTQMVLDLSSFDLSSLG